jgi:hypothetical protein
MAWVAEALKRAAGKEFPIALMGFDVVAYGGRG